MLIKSRNILVAFFLIFFLAGIVLFWMYRPDGPEVLQRGGIIHEENFELTSKSAAQEKKVNSVAIYNVPDYIDPKAIEVIERFNERVAGITEEDLARERMAIDGLRSEQERKALRGEPVEEESAILTLVEGGREFGVIKRVFPDGEVRYDLPNKYDPLNESAGWE